MVKRIFTLPVLFYFSDDRKVFGRNRLITTNAYARFRQQEKKNNEHGTLPAVYND